MRSLSAAQVSREIDQLKKIISVYYHHNLSDMIEDAEKRIVELEGILLELLDRGGLREISNG
jgi:hypothetical protein